MNRNSNHRSSPIAERRAGRDGMVSFATLLALLFLAVFMGLVANSGQIVTRKIEAQNAADAVAYSSSVWIARGMNAVTAANHMIGELQAMYVLHHSLGGKFLDEEDSSEENSDGLGAANGGLDASYMTPSPGSVMKPNKPYDEVKKNPNASKESTIYKAKRQLKFVLTGAYAVHTAGGWLEQVKPYGVLPGLALQYGALAVEWKAYQEYLVLTAVERVAQGTKRFAHAIAGVTKDGEESFGVIDGLVEYSYNADLLISAQVQRCAREVAEKHGAEGLVFGDGSISDPLTAVPRLPVERHLHKGADRSQLMRAHYPWVCHWRKPIRVFFSGDVHSLRSPRFLPR